MVSVTQQTLAAGQSLAHVTRPAKALIGWLPQNEAQLVLAQRMIQMANAPQHVASAAAAIRAVAARDRFESSEYTVEDPEAGLGEYITRFISQPEYEPYRQEGWQIKVVDLSKVIALQPVVFWDHAQERTVRADHSDLRSVAEITLPVSAELEQLPLQFDATRNTWMITSRNPNLRILGPISALVDTPGGQKVTSCGFGIAVCASYVQVVRYKGRLLLRDGYHRSLGLVSRAVTRAPVLFREFGQFDNLGLGAGMLPEAAFLGERPPHIADYLDDAVAAQVEMPASQKMIVVQGIEMSPLG